MSTEHPCALCDGTGVVDDARDFGRSTMPCPWCETESHRRARAALRAALADLVAALPKCDQCARPATRAHGRGSFRFCDVHGEGVPDYPRAEPLRRAVALLAATDATIAAVLPPGDT